MSGSSASMNLARILLTLALVAAPASIRAELGGADGESDAVTDELDTCPFVFNPDQADGNNDGLGDPCDSENVQLSLAEDTGSQSALVVSSDAARIAAALRTYLAMRAIGEASISGDYCTVSAMMSYICEPF